MSKLLKKRMAQEYDRELNGIESFVLFDYGKITAEQMYELRKELKNQNINIRVVKNKIAAITFSDLYENSLEKTLEGPTALAYGGESPADVAKALITWNKKKKIIAIKGGLLAKQPINKKQVENLSKIPPKPVLLSMLAGSFKSPLKKVVTMVKAPAQELSYAFKALTEKKEKEGN